MSRRDEDECDDPLTCGVCHRCQLPSHEGSCRGETVSEKTLREIVNVAYAEGLGTPRGIVGYASKHGFKVDIADVEDFLHSEWRQFKANDTFPLLLRAGSEIIHGMKYDGSRHKFAEGVLIDELDDGRFIAWQAASPKSNPIGTYYTLGEAMRGAESFLEGQPGITKEERAARRKF